MALVYVDTETTGLDPALHEVWEIAYAVDDGPVISGVVPHSLRNANPVSLSMNGYYARAPLGGAHTYGVDEGCRTALQGATLIAANPAFDAAFLRARWGVSPWYYRLFDIEAYAMGALGHAIPQGLATIVRYLRDEGFDIPEPDHSAAADVATLRACHKALRSRYYDLRLGSGL